MFVEPCCINRQLPKIIMEGSRYFQTNGDIRIIDFLGCLSSIYYKRHTVMIIVVPEIDITTLIQLRKTLDTSRREGGGIEALMLLTKEDQTALIKSQMNGLYCITYAHHPMVLDGLMVCMEESMNIIIQGAMLTQIDKSLCQYACSTDTEQKRTNECLSGILPKFRIYDTIKSNNQFIQKILNL